MPGVRVDKDFETSLRAFKRACEKASILSDVRRHEFYEKPTAKRKRKRAAAVKRHLKKIAKETMKFATGKRSRKNKNKGDKGDRK